MNNSEITAVGFLIFPGFPMSCLTSIIEPLRAANEIAERETFSWQLISETGSKVTSSAGVIFEPDVALSAKLDPAMIFLLSGPLSEFEAPRASNSVLRKLERTGAVLGGISGGVFPLVKSGVMEGYKCSVHWCYEAAFKSEFPEMLASGEVIVTDRRRYTASGAAAAFDLALQLIEERLGPDIALEVACWFQHPMMRGEGVEQRVPLKPSTDPALPDLVGRSIEMFVERLDEPRSVGDIAKALGVTPRQVERAFKKATGQSPSHYFRALRMNAARQLVLYSKDSTAQVAAAVGFSTTTPFVNHYRNAFGVTPKQDRGRINAFRVQGNMPLPST